VAGARPLRRDEGRAPAERHAAGHRGVRVEDGTRPIDAIAQDCCRIAEIVEHRRAEHRRAAKDEPPFDPDAEPPIDPDGFDPRIYAVRMFVGFNTVLTPDGMRAWRDHIAYTMHQAGRAMLRPAEHILEFETGRREITNVVSGHCRVAEVWEWRKAQRRVWKQYWQRRGSWPPPPVDPAEVVDPHRPMTAEEFRRWQARHRWNDELAAVVIIGTADEVRRYASGEAPIPLMVRNRCYLADRPSLPPQRRAPWRER